MTTPGTPGSDGTTIADPGPPAAAVPPMPVARRRVALVGARLLIWAVYGYVVITTVVLVLGFVLLLFGANADASFAAWVYRSLDRAMEPFSGIFEPVALGGMGEVGAVLDTSVLFAILVYAIVAWLLGALLGWLGDFLASLTAADEHAARLAQWANQSARAATRSQSAPKDL